MVSEHVFKFLLDELDTVRIVCQSSVCGAVLEIPVGDVPRVFQQIGRCKVCGADFDRRTAENPNSVVDLAKAITAAKDAKERYRVEFVLPDGGK